MFNIIILTHEKIKFHIDDYGILPRINKNVINFIKKDKIDSIIPFVILHIFPPY